MHHLGKFGEVGFEPVLLGVLLGRRAQVLDHGVDVVLEPRHLTEGLHLNRAGEITFGDRRRHIGDGPDLRGEIGRQQVYVVGQILPNARGARHVGLAAQPAVNAHFTGDGGDLLGEDSQCVGHVINGLGQGRHFAFGFDGQLFSETSIGHGGHDFDDASHLGRQVSRHDVDVVGQILPGAGDTGHLGLAAQFAICAHLAGHTGDLRRETAQLIDHRIDRVLELQDLTLHVHGDLFGQVAVGHGDGYIGDVAHLGR